MLIKIKTLDRTFVTNPEHWLGHSTYFEALFSGRWSSQEEDGSYSIESEGAMFEHILRHLRSGVLPIFYDADKGHDFSLYHSVLQEAEYFGIVRLSKWIREKKYLDAVQIHYVAGKSRRSLWGRSREHIVPDHAGGSLFREVPGSLKVAGGGHMHVSITPITQLRNVDVTGSGEGKNEQILTFSVVRKEMTIDHDLCVNAFR